MDFLLDVHVGVRLMVVDALQLGRGTVRTELTDADATTDRPPQSLDGQLSLSHDLKLSRPIAFVHGSELVPSTTHPIGSNSCKR